MAKGNKGGIEARKMAVGETIEFDRVIKQHVDTRFGAAMTAKFVKDGKIVRSLFAGSGLLNWLDENKNAKKVTLVQQIPDGELTYNIYE